MNNPTDTFQMELTSLSGLTLTTPTLTQNLKKFTMKVSSLHHPPNLHTAANPVLLFLTLSRAIFCLNLLAMLCPAAVQCSRNGLAPIEA
jgi:hypothetical protein